MMAAVPAIKVTHNTYSTCIGRPYYKTGSGDAIYGSCMSPQFIIYAPLISLTKQEQVILTNGR